MDKVTTIFFDIDNTLVNHSGAETKAIQDIKEIYFPELQETNFRKVWNEETQKFWKQYERKELTFKEQRIKRISSIWKIFEQNITDEQTSEIFNKYLTLYEKSWEVFPDVLEILEQLKQQNIAIGIISNGNKKQQVQKLKKVGIYEFIEENIFIVSEEVGFAKPDPNIFLFAQEKAKVKASQILFVGDNPKLDIEPSRKLGWNVVLIDYFEKYPEEKSVKSLKDII